MFQENLGRIVEVYIDDMVVKSLLKTDHIEHLEEAFEVLRTYS